MGESVVPHDDENLLQIEADEDEEHQDEGELSHSDSEGPDCMGVGSDEPNHMGPPSYETPSPRSVQISSD